MGRPVGRAGFLVDNGSGAVIRSSVGDGIDLRIGKPFGNLGFRRRIDSSVCAVRAALLERTRAALHSGLPAASPRKASSASPRISPCEQYSRISPIDRVRFGGGKCLGALLS